MATCKDLCWPLCNGQFMKGFLRHGGKCTDKFNTARLNDFILNLEISKTA